MVGLGGGPPGSMEGFTRTFLGIVGQGNGGRAGYGGKNNAVGF